MLNLIQADLFKLRKSSAMKILLGITTLCALVMTFIAYLIPQGKMEASITGIGFMFSDINVISILGGFMAGILICGDFENKTIHDAIANGSSRSTVIVSKAVILGMALICLLLPYAIITFISLCLGSEFSMGSVAVVFLHLLTTEGGSVLSAAEIWKTIAIALTLMIVYAAQLSICVPLAFKLKKPILVVVIYYAFSIFTAQLIRLGDSYPWFGRVLSFTPYAGDYTFLTLDTTAGDLFLAILFSVIFIIIMVGITSLMFRRSEIK
ncbi:ABC transporter permease [Paenibacillus sp. 1001270B_150601_E10]|uniref:ABC transporter permease n=1 Tax=Paenibacillus sp. 1001270B_150601_E10 TaxID=2787079 RepID=UPI00189CCE7C|nr:ABC transporter permease [Paenibacillus sp. 1001270B_150601_E10]